jgi:ribonuclease R
MARKRNRPVPLFEEVLDVLNNSPGKAWNYKQLAAALGINDNDERQVLIGLLQTFVIKGLAEEVELGKFRSKTSARFVEGKVDTTQNGAAYVIPDEGKDIYIPARYTNGALHGDRVKVKVFSRKNSGTKEEGEIIDIVTRARTEFVGTLHIEPRIAFLEPDNRKIPDMLIPKDRIGKAKSGQKVVVRMTSWEDFSDLPHAEVVAVLGEPGDNNTEMNAIMIEFGLPYKFPKDIEKIMDRIPVEITPEEVAKRRDFRGITTFTIDPVDAKDFDDALSVRQLENGHYEIGVHIADVSHYLKPGSLLDKEAVERGTSVYLVDRVVPMLPELLSNFVCSLRPDEDKLTFSAVFELDDQAKIHTEWFGRTVIRSTRRFAYEQVQEVLEGKTEDALKPELLLLDKLAKQLRKERLSNGAITFDREEVKFHLDEHGNPTGVYFKVMKDANQLIEDFMLLANRRVAEYVTLNRKTVDAPDKNKSQSHDLRRPFVYRVHASPDPQRVKEFSSFVSTFGYKLQTGNDQLVTHSLNKLLHDVQGKPEANMIETLAIRAMAKAIYTTDNIGHYGLGFRYYTHFTSPIRRYPDVMAHRLLQYYLDRDNGKIQDPPQEKNELEQLCKHSSDREKVAAEAERASIRYKQVQFLQDKVGGLFDGIVSGVTEFGFFVELAENKCEGMVHVRSLTDDRYYFDQDHYCLRGARSGKTYSLGAKVRVIVKNADLVKKQLDFVLADQSESRHSTSRTFPENSGRSGSGKKRGPRDDKKKGRRR